MMKLNEYFLLRADLISATCTIHELHERAIGGDILALVELDAVLRALKTASDNRDEETLKRLVLALAHRGKLN